MFGIKQTTRPEDTNLEFDMEVLEDRQMLAADFSVVGGDSLRVTGENSDSGDVVSVSTNESGFVTVDGQNTGLTQLKNLSINLKGGNDYLSVGGTGSNALNVTGRTTIRLGAGADRVDIGGQHDNLRIIGSNDPDQVYASHQIRNANTTISLKGGNDQFSFDTGMIVEAAQSGRADLSRYFSTPTPETRFNVNMGSGNDLVSRSDVGEGQEQSLPASNLLFGDTFVLFAAGNLNGGSGNDTLAPTGLLNIVNAAEARLRGFETEADLNVNQAPTAVDEVSTIPKDGIARVNVLANDSDYEGDILQLVSVNGFETGVQFDVISDGGRLGSAFFSPDGEISFFTDGEFDDLGFRETDSVTLTYTISDGELTSNATLTVTMLGLN